MRVKSFRIESEGEADDYLRELLAKKEYRSMYEVEVLAQRHISDAHLEIYFINRAKEILASQ
jgi:hypothetical protein